MALKKAKREHIKYIFLHSDRLVSFKALNVKEHTHSYKKIKVLYLYLMKKTYLNIYMLFLWYLCSYKCVHIACK